MTEVTKTMVEEFHKKGFLHVKGFYPLELIEILKKKLFELEKLYPNYCVYDKSVINDELVLHKIYSPCHIDSEFSNLIMIRKIHELIECIWSDEVILLTDKINLKLPGGRGYVAHQDMQGFFKKYVDNIITAFICIDDSEIENGCLELAEEMHTHGLFGKNNRRISQKYLKEINFKKMPQKAGDVIFFDGFVPHRSAPNNSNFSRRCLLLTFNKKKLGNFRERFTREPKNFKYC